MNGKFGNGSLEDCATGWAPGAPTTRRPPPNTDANTAAAQARKRWRRDVVVANAATNSSNRRSFMTASSGTQGRYRRLDCGGVTRRPRSRSESLVGCGNGGGVAYDCQLGRVCKPFLAP